VLGPLLENRLAHAPLKIRHGRLRVVHSYARHVHIEELRVLRVYDRDAASHAVARSDIYQPDLRCVLQQERSSIRNWRAWSRKRDRLRVEDGHTEHAAPIREEKQMYTTLIQDIRYAVR